MNETAPKLRDPDLLKAGAALLRASLKAQELAHKTGTPCYVWQDGKIVNIGAAAPVVATTPVA
jgi:hypothetical protein